MIAFVFLSDGIPIIYAGQEQHYSGGNDPYNREATWLSGYSTSAELYEFITATNKIRKLAISSDSSYLTSTVCSEGTCIKQKLIVFTLERPILPR